MNYSYFEEFQVREVCRVKEFWNKLKKIEEIFKSYSFTSFREKTSNCFAKWTSGNFQKNHKLLVSHSHCSGTKGLLWPSIHISKVPSKCMHLEFLKLKLQIMTDNSCDYCPLSSGTTTKSSRSHSLCYYLLRRFLVSRFQRFHGFSKHDITCNEKKKYDLILSITLNHKIWGY